MKFHACLFACLFGSLAATALLMPGTGMCASGIYKTTDANGNTVFTDVPPASGDRSGEPVELKETNTWQAPRSGETSDRTPWIVDETGADTASEDTFVPYSTLAIVAPVHDSSLRENSGFVSVAVELIPPLAADHRLRILLDGKPAGQGSSTIFPLENVDRGTHSLIVEVVNETGASLQQSTAATFHMQRYHLPPPTPKPPPKPGPKPAPTPKPTAKPNL